MATLHRPAADKNEANGSFDPLPFFTGFHAQDYWTVVHLMPWVVSLLGLQVSQLEMRSA
jgi:hypothetical protein